MESGTSVVYLSISIADFNSKSRVEDTASSSNHSLSFGTTPVNESDGEVEGFEMIQARPKSSNSSQHNENLTSEQVLEQMRYDYALFARDTGFSTFFDDVYPLQSRLVLAYVVEAFTTLGCSLANMTTGTQLPLVKYLPHHELLMKQLHIILEDGGLIEASTERWIRTDKVVDLTSSSTILKQILERHPKFKDEHYLLDITGSKLAQCLNGSADPIRLLFADKENRLCLERVYQSGPMYKAMTSMLAEFLKRCYANKPGRRIRILEIGGGTGGTTKFLSQFLLKSKVDFEYTFTDVSSALVTAAKRTFAGLSNMRYAILDIEKSPAEQHLAQYDTVISTNCIHATRDLTSSLANIRKMLQPDGFLALVEFTRNLFWFDLVFGLLDGWWRFRDGRNHPLASVDRWGQSLVEAGFSHYSFTSGATEESRTLRIISGFNNPASGENKVKLAASQRTIGEVKTVVWKSVKGLDLMADIYLPKHRISGDQPIGESHVHYPFTITDRR